MKGGVKLNSKVKKFLKSGNKALIKEGLERVCFTDDEGEIIKLILKEYNDIKISMQLNYSLRTLQRRKQRIYSKIYNTLIEWDEFNNMQ